MGGPIALVEEGDIIKINIPENTLKVAVSDEEMAAETCKMAAERAKGDHRLSGTLRTSGNIRKPWSYS